MKQIKVVDNDGARCRKKVYAREKSTKLGAIDNKAKQRKQQEE